MEEMHMRLKLQIIRSFGQSFIRSSVPSFIRSFVRLVFALVVTVRGKKRENNPGERTKRTRA